MVETIAMIDAIPMITPSMVRKERNLWDQIPFSASLIFSLIVYYSSMSASCVHRRASTPYFDAAAPAYS
jgi:hypothetical protein